MLCYAAGLDPYTEDNPKVLTRCNHHFHLPVRCCRVGLCCVLAGGLHTLWMLVHLARHGLCLQVRQSQLAPRLGGSSRSLVVLADCCWSSALPCETCAAAGNRQRAMKWAGAQHALMASCPFVSISFFLRSAFTSGWSAAPPALCAARRCTLKSSCECTFRSCCECILR